MTDNPDHGAKLLSLTVHEFRTPVSVVAGYLRMLLRYFGDTLTDQQRKLVEESEKSCGSLAGLLNELSDLASLEAGPSSLRRECVDLAPILTQLARDVHEGEDRGITLEVQRCDERAQVLGDPVRLASALMTLVTAAIRERSEPTSMMAVCRVADTPDGRILRIAIAEQETIDMILTSPGEGTFDEYRGGLGFRLVLASRIIAAHGGRIATPIAERGYLAVVVSLPAAPEPEPAALPCMRVA